MSVTDGQLRLAGVEMYLLVHIAWLARSRNSNCDCKKFVKKKI